MLDLRASLTTPLDRAATTSTPTPLARRCVDLRRAAKRAEQSPWAVHAKMKPHRTPCRTKSQRGEGVVYIRYFVKKKKKKRKGGWEGEELIMCRSVVRRSRTCPRGSSAGLTMTAVLSANVYVRSMLVRPPARPRPRPWAPPPPRIAGKLAWTRARCTCPPCG